MKNFIAISNSFYKGWVIIGKFDKLKSALDATARHWKKNNSKCINRIIDKTKREIIYFKNKQILTRQMTEREIKDWL